MKHADKNSNAKQIDLTVGETLELRLEENRTTGFKWVVVSAGEPACTLISDSFEPGTAIGQPGSHVWEFRAEQPGEAGISLSYQRPWDEKEAAAGIFTLRVRVSR